MIKVLSKLAEARTHIKAHKIKPDAKNEFSNYAYFSPEIVSKLVTDACIETDSICLFDLKKDELGYYGELRFIDLESGEAITSVMRTEKPVIKATNETQQMGGMNTYTKRYCLMSLFDIEDNSSDFDAQDNSRQPEPKQQPKKEDDGKPWLNKGTPQYNAVIKRLQEGTTTIKQVGEHYKLSKDIKANLEACTKQLQALTEVKATEWMS